MSLKSAKSFAKYLLFWLMVLTCFAVLIGCQNVRDNADGRLTDAQAAGLFEFLLPIFQANETE